MRAMTNTVLTSTKGKALSGILAYVRQDHAFDFRPLDPEQLSAAVGAMGTTSLLIGSLQIEVSVETGRFLFAWGYHPMQAWEEGTVHPLAYQPGHVSLVKANLKPGVSEAIAEVGEWPTVQDRSTGWVQVRDPVIESATAIEFAEDAVAGIADDRLVALWLRPIFE